RTKIGCALALDCLPEYLHPDSSGFRTETNPDLLGPRSREWCAVARRRSGEADAGRQGRRMREIEQVEQIVGVSIALGQVLALTTLLGQERGLDEREDRCVVGGHVRDVVRLREG